MRKLLTALGIAVLLALPVQADTTGDWTEVTFTLFDKVDGELEPELSGAVTVFNQNKGIGWYLGEGVTTGPLGLWKVWKYDDPAKRFNVSIFGVGSTDVTSADENGLFDNGVIGLEPRFWWEWFGNAEVGLGILMFKFQEAEKAEWVPYFKLAFRPSEIL
jgi:hypothetical protein